ncbi:hypothetical protein COU59_00725 [Candidatus Pacearchaeota archaeon CG10_big_fil_rev_8_21_14_0_10_34_12]|nr:MAG: hypothetical protein COU59_00725 [Candidatus Pacearchaeota archaeon CG10_big_fil_rev_8_21_14_0_10_34_12]
MVYDIMEEYRLATDENGEWIAVPINVPAPSDIEELFASQTGRVSSSKKVPDLEFYDTGRHFSEIKRS